MYVGHSLLAFALGALLARRAGVGRSPALTIGALAGGFALLPDVDTAHTVLAVLAAGPDQVFPTPRHVWTAEAWRVHRSLTHSLPIGAVASVGAWALGSALDGRGDLRRSLVPVVAGAAAFWGILAVGLRTDGQAGLATAGLYVVGAMGFALVAHTRGVAPRWLGVAAAVGLLSHPFGDLFMGRPPAFLYPLVRTPLIPKVAVAADPTVNLVALFLLEVALAWAALWTLASARGWRLRAAVDPRAVLALGFAGAALFIRPPTLQVAYHFAVGALSTGVVLGVLPGVLRGRVLPDGRGSDRRAGVVTGLAAVTLALLSYLVAYLVVGP